MKKKITGLCILLLVLLLGLSLNSYAITNPQLTKLDISVNADKEQIFDEVYSHYYNVNINNLSSTQLINFNNLKSNFINSLRSSISYQFSRMASSSQAYQFNFFFANNNDYLNFPTSNVVYASNISYSSCSHGQVRGKQSFSFYSWTQTNYPIIQNTSSYDTYYVLTQDKLGNWWEWSTDGWSIGDALTPDFDFLAESIGTITLPHDNGTDIAYCISPITILSPGVDGWKYLGHVVNYSDYNNLKVRCIVYDRVVSGELMSGSVVGSLYYYINDDGELMFNPIRLYNTLLYQFLFSETDELGQTYLAGTVYFYVGNPTDNPSFGTTNLDWSNPQVFAEGLIGTNSSGDSPGTGILGGISSFFNGLYQRFFVLDDDSIQDIYQNSVDLLPSGESPIDFYNTILNVAQSSSSDFVISWPDIDFDMLIAGQHISSKFISGDSINFNALIRADERISNMWSVFQTIITFTVYYLLFVGWYDCILRLLGVSDGLITEDSDDITTVGTVESVSSSVDMNSGEVKESNKIRKTTYRRTVTRK